MTVLLVDNYDSFTYNLAQLVAQAGGEYPLVVKNDADESELDDLDYDAVVLSPGPGRPESHRDFGLCSTLLSRADVPMLGVCLGHQGIAHAFGGNVVHAPEPMHGRISAVNHRGEGLFRNLPSPFSAVRYHSLLVENLPEHLHVDAQTDDGLIMSLSHRTRPIWGVQFHPESILTEYGTELLGNFLRLAQAKRSVSTQSNQPISSTPSRGETLQSRYQMRVREIRMIPPKTCFDRLFRASEYSFWLDSSSSHLDQGRYSYMGDASGPAAKTLRYDANKKELHIGGIKTPNVSIFDYLESEAIAVENPDECPCPFKGGYVGFFGYELKAECGGAAVHKSPHDDSAFLFADRYVAFDHVDRRAWLVCLHRPGAEKDAQTWFDCIEQRINQAPPEGELNEVEFSTDTFQPRHTRADYIELIDKALEKITDGESYEICLTNMWRSEFSGDALELYQALRAANPAPYSAFMSFGSLKILSCSPERFLQISPDGCMESKPIKGTAKRDPSPELDLALAEELRTSEKNRAENLMIVDLIRNDLNRVCKTGSVRVAKLYDIESYKTVHQMVSTVVGELAENVAPIAAIKSLFPGGSMTGAPKIRTMEIIDQLEAGPRGIYSGALGFLSIDGAVDLNIIIRTLVIDGDQISIGAGGAIVSLSDPVDEYEETLTKADVMIRTTTGKLPSQDANPLQGETQ